MAERFWLVLPNGGRQLIDPNQFDMTSVAEHARRLGARLVSETVAPAAEPARPRGFEPPISSLGPLFKARLSRIHVCKVEYFVDVNTRPTVRVLGGYYKVRRLVRIYSHDRQTGRRPLDELFDTFLHEMAHHLEYTEPSTFNARACGRIPGRMHSPLFWRILGELKGRWADVNHSV